MRTFITAVCILAVILVFVIFSSYRSTAICKELKTIAESLPNDTADSSDFDDKLKKFNATWNDERLFIHLIIGHTENQAIEDSLDDLAERHKSGDHPGYMSARKRLISAIERIIDMESLSIDTIF